MDNPEAEDKDIDKDLLAVVGVVVVARVVVVALVAVIAEMHKVLDMMTHDVTLMCMEEVGGLVIVTIMLVKGQSCNEDLRRFWRAPL